MSYPIAGLVRSYVPPGYVTDHPMVPHGSTVQFPVTHIHTASRISAPISSYPHVLLQYLWLLVRLRCSASRPLPTCSAIAQRHVCWALRTSTEYVTLSFFCELCWFVLYVLSHWLSVYEATQLRMLIRCGMKTSGKSLQINSGSS